MNETEIIFKSEDSMWQMLASGEKTHDERRWDMEDERIVRLCKGHWVDRFAPELGPKNSLKDYRVGNFYQFDEPFVSFVNKATGEVLKFRFHGLNFLPWAPGWVFMELGGIVERREMFEITGRPK